MKVRAHANVIGETAGNVVGYFEHVRRRVGDVFTIPDEPRRKIRAKPEIEYEEVIVNGEEKKVPKRRYKADGKLAQSLADKNGTIPSHFSETWMEPVAVGEPEKVTTGKEALKTFRDETLASKMEKGGRAGTGSQEVI